MKPSRAVSHGSGILISSAYPLIGAALIEPAHLALLLAAFGIPIMASWFFPFAVSFAVNVGKTFTAKMPQAASRLA